MTNNCSWSYIVNKLDILKRIRCCRTFVSYHRTRHFTAIFTEYFLTCRIVFLLETRMWKTKASTIWNAKIKQSTTFIEFCNVWNKHNQTQRFHICVICLLFDNSVMTILSKTLYMPLKYIKSCKIHAYAINICIEFGIKWRCLIHLFLAMCYIKKQIYK